MSQQPRELHAGRSALDLFGAELRHWRHLRGLSQAELAALVHFGPDLICKVEKAERWPRPELADACDAALDTGGLLGRILPWVQSEHRRTVAHADSPPAHADSAPAGQRAGTFSGFLPHTGRTARAGTPPRPPAAPAAPAAPVAPAAPKPDGTAPTTLEAYLAMTAHESARFSDHPSNVGPATLEQLRSDATRLARMFAAGSRLEVFAHARWLRDRAFELLDGRQLAAETRDLYFLAGAACGMLAEATTDFGCYAAAMAHTRAALLCAGQAGHAGLTAWIRGEQSLIAYHDGRPRHAAEFARRGQECGAGGTVSVWLPAQEAKCTARLGDAEATRAALARAAAARERVTGSELDELGGLMAFGGPKQRYYAAESYLGIGDHAAAVAEAEECLAGYRTGPDGERAYDNMASTHVNQAQALVADDLEAARDAAGPAFGIAPELRTEPLRQRLRLLHGRLGAPAVAAAPVAVDLRGRIEDFLAAPPAALPAP